MCWRVVSPLKTYGVETEHGGRGHGRRVVVVVVDGGDRRA